MSLTIGIIGLGLIGGSVARSMKKFHPECRIMAYSRTLSSVEQAKADGVIDIICTRDDPFFAACDYIFMCAPVENNAEYLAFLRENMRPSCILTDVGSVKAPIHEAIEAAGLSHCFIGGHPMAGSEKTGYANSTDFLLENAYYILTPTEEVDPAAVTRFSQLISSIGGLPLIMSREEHDKATAAISHVPHLIAAALVNTVHKLDGPEHYMKTIAAGGFKDITRIASSSPEMWQQICDENRENICGIIDEYIDMLLDARQRVMMPGAEGVYEMFEESRDYRNSFGNNSSGPIKRVYSFSVDIYDEPGGIAAITIMLAMRGISIKNIGIIHNRAFDEGVLNIEFYDQDSMELAIEILSNRNYTIHTRK